MINKSRNEFRICRKASQQMAEFGDLGFFETTLQVFRSLIQISGLRKESQPLCGSQHGFVQTHNVAAQNFVQHKVTDKRCDVRHLLQRLDSLFQGLSPKFFEVIRIRRFENGSQNRPDSETFPVRLVERCEHQFKFVYGTDTNFIQVEKGSDQLLQAGIGESPLIVF